MVDCADPPYSLIPHEKQDALRMFTATLTSPLLDPRMHKNGELEVHVGRGWTSGKTTSMHVEPFQLESLATYVRDQDGIRKALEAALDEHLAKWHYQRIGR